MKNHSMLPVTSINVLKRFISVHMKILKYVNQLIGLCLGMLLWACHVHADDIRTSPESTTYAAPKITWYTSNPKFGSRNALIFKVQVESSNGGLVTWIRWKNTDRNGVEMTPNKAERGQFVYTMDAAMVAELSAGKHHIEIKARDMRGNETSWVRLGNVTIVRALPVITWDSSNPAVGSKKALTFKANIKSPVEGVAIETIRIRWKGADQNGVAMTGANGKYSYTLDAQTVRSLPEGREAIEMKGVDELGNETGWFLSYLWVMRTLPVITRDRSNPTFGNREELTFKASIRASIHGIAIEKTRIRWKSTDQNGVEMTGANDEYGYTMDAQTVRALPEGKHTIEMMGVDVLGNDTGWRRQGDVTIIRSVPVITWDSSNPILGSKKPLTFKANIKSPVEGVAIEKTRIRWKSTDQNGVAMTPHRDQYRYTLDAKALPEGKHTIEMMGMDAAGNDTGWLRQGDVMIVRTAPVITWNSSNPTLGSKDQLTFNVKIKSPVVGVAIETVSFRFNNERLRGTLLNYGSGEYGYTLDAKALPEGKHTIEMMGVDAAGNDTGWLKQGDVRIVRTAPVITWDSSNPAFGNKDALTFKAHIKSPVEGVAIEKTKIRWKSTDQNGVEMTGANDEYGYTMDTQTVRALSVGKHTIEMMGVDVLGNDTGWRRQGDVTIVRTVPKVIWDKNNAQYTQDNRITLNASVTDACCGITAVSMRFAEVPNLIVPMKKQSGDVFSVLLDSGSMNLPEGVIHVEIKADNEAGNSTDWVLSGQFTVLQRNSDHKVIEKLKLEKSVLPEGPVLPGATLHYTLKFTNMNAEPLRELIINGDYSTEHGVIKNAQCGDMKSAAGLSCCVVSDEKGTCIAPFVENPERLEWHFNGELPSGGVGTVTYELQVHP
jgi:hypothetical protein